MEQEILRLELEKRIDFQRYKHSLGVEETAVQLAKCYGADPKKAALAGLLHDWAKGLENEMLLKKAIEFDIVLKDIEREAPNLLHGPVGAKMVEAELGIKDREVLEAIALHTTGEKGMSLLAKIIYLADYIEPNRKFPGVKEIRKFSFLDLDQALLLATESTLNCLLQKKALIHAKTIGFRNSLLINKGG